MNRRIMALLTAGLILTGCGAQSQAAPTDMGNTPTGQAATDMGNMPAEQVSADAPAKAYQQPEMKGELTISAMDEIAFLSEAAESFMLKYPDVKVNINNFREMEVIEIDGREYTVPAAASEGLTDEDYRSQLNTKIMSQTTEDIIMTSPLRMEKYGEMGAFEDLSWYLSQTAEINPDTFYMPVIENFRTGGKLFDIPLDLSMYSINFNGKLVQESGIRPYETHTAITQSEALEIGKQIVDSTDLPNTYLSRGDVGVAATGLIEDDLNLFINSETKEVNFAVPAFYEILENAKSLADNGYYDNGTIDFYNMEYYFSYITDFDTQSALESVLYRDSSISFVPIPICNKDGKVSYSVPHSVGINSKSQVKDLAWEFVKFLLSDEVQSSPSQSNIGVNRSSLPSLTERNSFLLQDDETRASFDLEAYTALLNDWAEMAEAPNRIDGAILETIDFEVREYLDGNKTAEEAAADINTKLDKYFNE